MEANDLFCELQWAAIGTMLHPVLLTKYRGHLVPVAYLVVSPQLVDKKFVSMFILKPIPVAAGSKAWVCGRSLAGIVGSKPTGGMDVCLL
jgi:hypothetical protein